MAQKSRLKTIARRTFLVGSAAVAGGVAFGYWKLKQPYPNPLLKHLPEGHTPLGDYVLLGPDGVTLITPRGEMGQGVQSAIAMLLAEELELPWEEIKFAAGPPGKAYYNRAIAEDTMPISPFDEGTMAKLMRGAVPLVGKLLAMQVTGGSSAMPDHFERMRVVGAIARETLKRAAAQTWATKGESLRAKDGKILGTGGQSIAYADLAGSLALVQVPDEVALKPKEQWRYIGKSMPRLDIPPKVKGTAMFSGDFRPKGLVFAALRLNPFRAGGFESYDDKAALAIPGVSKVIEIDAGLAVIAVDSWSAMKGAQALSVQWKKASYPQTTQGHYEACLASLDGEPQNTARDEGNCDKALGSDETLSAEYRAPYLAHACMEPVNATVRWDQGEGGGLEMWVGHQTPTDILDILKKKFQLNPDQAKIHVQYMGGGFGRKLESDYCDYAIQVARAMPGVPVQVFFSRSEDLQNDFYRPIAVGRAQGLVKDKKIHALDLQVAAVSIMDSMMDRNSDLTVPGPDSTITMTLNYQPYQIRHYRCRGYRVSNLLPVASWRSVGASQNAFFHESMMDELITGAGLDPLAARMDLIQEPTCKAVLRAVGKLSRWGSPLPKHRARGLAFWVSFGVPCAQVVEIEQQERGIRVVKVYAVVDPGIAIDPQNVEAQLFSAINFGLGSAMFNEITVQGGRVKQSNFHDFAPLRMYQSPEFELRVLQDNPHVRGMGEPGVPPAAPALANAIFALTQKRLREMPFSKSVQFA